jgi:hypothetical protein
VRNGGHREPCDDGGVGPGGFGTLALRMGEGTYLCLVHDHGRQSECEKAAGDHEFQAAGLFQRDGH